MNRFRLHISEQEFLSLTHALVEHRPRHPQFEPPKPPSVTQPPDEQVARLLMERGLYLTDGLWKFTTEMQAAQLPLYPELDPVTHPQPSNLRPYTSYWLIVEAAPTSN